VGDGTGDGSVPPPARDRLRQGRIPWRGFSLDEQAAAAAAEDDCEKRKRPRRSQVYSDSTSAGPTKHNGQQSSMDENGNSKPRIACFQCRKKKMKCDTERPQCYNCKRYNSTCEYTATIRRRGEGKKTIQRREEERRRRLEGSDGSGTEGQGGADGDSTPRKRKGGKGKIGARGKSGGGPKAPGTGAKTKPGRGSRSKASSYERTDDGEAEGDGDEDGEGEDEGDGGGSAYGSDRRGEQTRHTPDSPRGYADNGPEGNGYADMSFARGPGGGVGDWGWNRLVVSGEQG